MKNQFLIGNTENIDAALLQTDGATIIGWVNKTDENMPYLLQAAAEAKYKDGIVHIDARLLTEILREAIVDKANADKRPHPAPITGYNAQNCLA